MLHLLHSADDETIVAPLGATQWTQSLIQEDADHLRLSLTLVRVKDGKFKPICINAICFDADVVGGNESYILFGVGEDNMCSYDISLVNQPSRNVHNVPGGSMHISLGMWSPSDEADHLSVASVLEHWADFGEWV